MPCGGVIASRATPMRPANSLWRRVCRAMSMCCSWSMNRPPARQLRALPVTHGTIGVKHPLQQLLFEGMFRDGALVHFYSKPWARGGTDGSAHRVQRMRVDHYLVAPFDVLAHGLADDEIRLREAELEGSRSADRPLRVVRRERDAVGFSERANLAGRGQSAAMRDVGLRNLAA